VVTLSQLMGQEPSHASIVPPAEDKKKSPELTPHAAQHEEVPAGDPDPQPEHREDTPPSQESIDSNGSYGRLAESPVLPTPESQRLAGSPLESQDGQKPPDESSVESLEEEAPVVLITPVEAPARWPDLVEDYALDRPFTSSPLRHSRLALANPGEGGTATLQVVFANEHHHDLFLADGDNRKSLRAFLATRLGPATPFALTYTAAAAHEGSVNGSAPKAIHPAESTEALIQSEPVIQALIRMFEGRVLN
jgi:hypothetical protein